MWLEPVLLFWVGNQLKGDDQVMCRFEDRQEVSKGDEAACKDIIIRFCYWNRMVQGDKQSYKAIGSQVKSLQILWQPITQQIENWSGWWSRTSELKMMEPVYLLPLCFKKWHLRCEMWKNSWTKRPKTFTCNSIWQYHYMQLNRCIKWQLIWEKILSPRIFFHLKTFQSDHIIKCSVKLFSHMVRLLGSTMSSSSSCSPLSLGNDSGGQCTSCFTQVLSL